MPREGPRRKIAGREGLRGTSGRSAPSFVLTTRVVLLGTFWGDRGGEAKGGGTSAASTTSTGRGLQSKGQQTQQGDQEPRKEKAYSSVAKYFRRFSKRQGKSSPRASLFLRRASKSTRKWPRRRAQGSTRDEGEAATLSAS